MLVSEELSSLKLKKKPSYDFKIGFLKYFVIYRQKDLNPQIIFGILTHNSSQEMF